jgi:hypothetical protein
MTKRDDDFWGVIMIIVGAVLVTAAIVWKVYL